MFQKVPIKNIRPFAWLAAWLAAALLVLIAHGPTAAQNHPAKPIKLVVPFGPGGPTDVAARLASLIIQSNLGQSVLIENRPGAGGALGTRAVASADPDGYTLLLGTVATLGALPAVTKSPGFDPVRSFAPVAKLTESSAVLVVPPSLSANTLGELIALAKANPGKLNYASAGVGNQTHLNAEVFRARAGIDIVHVPYKSGAEMVTAVLGADLVHRHFDPPAIDQRAEGQAAGDHRPEAASVASGNPDPGRERDRSRGNILDRCRGPGRHAADRRHHTERFDQQRPDDAGCARHA